MRGEGQDAAGSGMRRVFYLITELDVGGAEKTLYELATRLDRERFEPAVGCLSGRGPVGDRLARAGVAVEYIGMRGWWDVSAWLRLRRVLRERRPHVLHTFLFRANLAGRLAAIGLGVERVICSVRVEEPRRWQLWLDRLTRGLVDVTACVSESARRYTHEHVKAPLAKLAVVPNGTDVAGEGSAVAPPAEWGLLEGVPVVGVIGRLHEQKDPLLMLRAAEMVLRRLPETVFAFAGEGPLAEACRGDAAARGIAGRVRWLGWQADVRPLLARMDVLALSSRWEGMPNVVLEAMSYGKPVVATAVGGSAELVVDGETGVLVRPGDAQALADGVVTLLEDGALCAAFGRAARSRVARDFSLEKMVAGNQALYEG